jgi:2-methylcitrate dehydratase PrpD
LSIKIHSSCGYTHRAIDGALGLRAQHLLKVDEITAIRVSLITMHRAILPFDAALTPAEALFSVPHTVALALTRGAVVSQDFTDTAVADPAVQALGAKVTVETRAPRRPELNMDPGDPDPVESTLSDGSVLATSVAAPRGTPFDPLAPDEVQVKFHRCAAISVDGARATTIAGACAGLDRLGDSRELTALLVAR